ncbi:hypothetical protein PV355_01815 [Streptomyces stelliscabiei]|uniref:hypothetical protein n=1 Tax=Streptomyces stelliscabiei TaxID=146820 RepID=UPI0029B24CA5|nr:hypothetical protein [Streptomyces stelliscabiei]MDX2513904.1 hypothetical protein [Streptomyces stelliscabiei]
MSQTHSLAEWASVLSLGVGVHASFSVFYFLLVDASLRDFDPRPLLGRAADRVLVEAVNARLLLRDAAITCAALLALLTVRPEALR